MNAATHLKAKIVNKICKYIAQLEISGPVLSRMIKTEDIPKSVAIFASLQQKEALQQFSLESLIRLSVLIKKKYLLKEDEIFEHEGVSLIIKGNTSLSDVDGFIIKARDACEGRRLKGLLKIITLLAAVNQPLVIKEGGIEFSIGSSLPSEDKKEVKEEEEPSSAVERFFKNLCLIEKMGENDAFILPEGAAVIHKHGLLYYLKSNETSREICLSDCLKAMAQLPSVEVINIPEHLLRKLL